MLRSVLATAVLAACHPAPAPTVVRTAPTAAAPSGQTSPVRQDFDLQLAPVPLAEVVATGHECTTAPPPLDRPMPAPIDDDPLVPINRRPLLITTGPVSPCRPLRAPLR